MNDVKSVQVTKEVVLRAIRDAASVAKGGCLGVQQFLRVSGLKWAAVKRFFPSWAAAVEAAGVGLTPYNKRVSDDELLADWGNVVRVLGRLPPAANYRFHGRYSPNTFEKRFHKWSNIGRAFGRFAQGRKEWGDVMGMLEKGRRAEGGGRRGPWSRPNRQLSKEELPAVGIPMTGRMAVGDPMDFPGLANEPTTESGVVYVFGMLAERLGFRVRWLQTGFPDCEALRKVGSGRWQPVRIEFEYLSGNFLLHKHDAKGCDLVVCWRDNWEGCPLEVIALRDVVAQRKMTNDPASLRYAGTSGNDE